MVVALLVLLLETIRDTQRNGDFIGYLNAGNLVLQGDNIYSDYLNTWPPFFSVFSVPLALFYQLSPFSVRLMWLLGSWFALFVTMRMTVSLFLKRKLLLPFQKTRQKEDMSFSNPMVLVPFLLCVRFLMDNAGFLQINLFILALTFGSVFLYHREKQVWAAMLLGFSIALKVFPIFVLLYFIYKGAYKLSAVAIGVVVLCCASTVLVFGWEEALAYHHAWVQNSVIPFPATSQMNQSLMAAFGRFLSDGSTGIGYTINIANLDTSLIKKIYYGSVIILAVYPLYLFRKRLAPTDISLSQSIQWALLFCALPLLSPVAWKPYFVFLWVPLFCIYFLLHSNMKWKWPHGKFWAKVLYYTSLPCLILSSELFTGVYFSDVLEVWNIITIGTILLLSSVFVVYLSADKPSLQKPIFSLQNHSS